MIFHDAAPGADSGSSGHAEVAVSTDGSRDEKTFSIRGEIERG
jgi:hypothetical protein